MALFAGCNIKDKNLALLLPLLCMFVTDIFLGFHMTMPFVYLSFMMISYIGINSKKITNGTILGSSVLFFLLTNFGVWYLGYPNTLAGLVSCYTLAIPFFVNTIIGDLFFAHSLSYSFSKLEEKYPILRLGEIK
jgi:phosphoglycerol transferase MdoB-like AlkP superfamily enzyme